MREILNSGLTFIGAESLTDDEWESVEDLDLSENVDRYTTLDGILFARESVSTIRDRLRNYYMAKGTDLPTVASGSSNVLVGLDISGC